MEDEVANTLIRNTWKQQIKGAATASNCQSPLAARKWL